MVDEALQRTLYYVCLSSPVICAVVGLVIMRTKGRSPAAGFLLGWFLNFVGVIIAFLLPHAPGTVNAPLDTPSHIRKRAQRVSGLLDGSYRYAKSKDALVRTSPRKFTAALKTLEKEPGEIIEACAFDLLKAYAPSSQQPVSTLATALSQGQQDAKRILRTLVRSLKRETWHDLKGYLHMDRNVQYLADLAKLGNQEARRAIQRNLQSKDLYARAALVAVPLPDALDDAERRRIFRECLNSQERLLWQRAITGLWSVIVGRILISTDDEPAAIIDRAKRARYYLDIDVLEPALSLISSESDVHSSTKSEAAVIISWLYHSGFLSGHQKNLIDQYRSNVVRLGESYSETSRGAMVEGPEGWGWDPNATVKTLHHRRITLSDYLDDDPPWQPPH